MNPRDNLAVHTLPEHLAERVTVVAPGDAQSRAHQPRARHAHGTFVLYWMRTAVRAHENPALDVALAMGAAHQLPVFVYHALSERYPYASDRHHTFILEGARDVAAECQARGIGYAFHLERPGHRQPALRRLAEQAALVVTETMPLPPLDAWTQRLASQIACPVWSVDTACVVPMPLVRDLPTRAYAYRDATAAVRAARLQRPWPDQPPHTAPFQPPLPFDPIDLAQADIPAYVAQCAIDHGVAPVADTRGGSRAGYARWRTFCESGRLARYAADRNDPLRAGVSQLSAYLHYGMVSPLRLAREAAALAKGATREGAEKFLDELLVWREVAYAFCYRHPAPTTVAAIPSWAAATLEQHAADPRPRLSWETMARARTGDPLWDAAQRSLLRQGALHNNVRMTWGKAVLGWTASATEALERLEDLNHRYALDGRDPASYGGLLWCLGQFDRPFTPAVPVLGTVRPRNTTQHAQRLNVEAYAARTAKPALHRVPRVVVVGAGISGLACARTLADHGVPVQLVEKSRGVGGRTSTRREGPWHFNHGAPAFASRDPRLAPYLSAWAQDGHITRALHATPGTWSGTWSGTPDMNRLAVHLSDGLPIARRTTVRALAHDADGWRIAATQGGAPGTPEESVSLTDVDVVVLALPAPQAIALLGSLETEASTAIRQRLHTVTMAPCWAALVVDADTPSTGRVIHADATWSAAHLEDAPETVLAALLAMAPAATTEAPLLARAHRWRYAQVTTGLTDSCLWDATHGLGVCGDWGGWSPETQDPTLGVERAWLSGVALAGRILSDAAR